MFELDVVRRCRPRRKSGLTCFRGLLVALVGLLLVLAGIVVGAVPAAAQNRVGASTPNRIDTVGPSAGIGAGQRLGKTVPQPQIVVATAVAADSVVQVSRTAEGAADGSGISLSAARAAAERNGIDTRLMDLSHEPGSPGQYGFTSFNGAGSLIRGASGRFQVTLTNLGLWSEADAVNTIAHELNHIREGMRTGGLPPSEGPAIWSGDTAELFFR